MSEADLVSVLGQLIDESAVYAVRRHWTYAQLVHEPITKFDSLSKGWDRLSAEIFPNESSIGHRFKKLTGLCGTVAWSQSIEDLLYEVDSPIRNDLEHPSHDAQRDFDRVNNTLKSHRNNQRTDQQLLESVGTLLWTIRSNSMHGRKTPSGPTGPTNRDEQICDLGARVMVDLYRFAFPDWQSTFSP